MSQQHESLFSLKRAGLVLTLASVLMLSACGETSTNRALSGGGIGATIGTVGGAVAGGAILPGLLVGGIIGVATGVVTSTDDIDLGSPIWE